MRSFGPVGLVGWLSYLNAHCSMLHYALSISFVGGLVLLRIPLFHCAYKYFRFKCCISCRRLGDQFLRVLFIKVAVKREGSLEGIWWEIEQRHISQHWTRTWLWNIPHIVYDHRIRCIVGIENEICYAYVVRDIPKNESMGRTREILRLQALNVDVYFRCFFRGEGGDGGGVGWGGSEWYHPYRE